MAVPSAVSEFFVSVVNSRCNDLRDIFFTGVDSDVTHAPTHLQIFQDHVVIVSTAFKLWLHICLVKLSYL